MTGMEIYRVVDFTTTPRTDTTQVQVNGKPIAYFDTGPEAKAFVRGYEAGARSALVDAANEAAQLNHQEREA